MSRNSLHNSNQGLTIVELMIAMAISGFCIAAIVMSFRTQESSTLVQEQVSMIQQNNRAAIYMIARELRLAGYDPDDMTDAGFELATASQVQITMDLNEDEDLNDSDEDVAFGFSSANDADGDGIADDGIADLGRDTGSGFLDIAQNIHAVYFAYAYDADDDDELDTYTLTSGPGAGESRVIWAYNGGTTWYNLDATGDGVIDESDGPGAGGTGAITGTNTTTTVDLGDIRAVKVWVLARSNRADSKYTNNLTYTVGRQVITPGDKFYRRLLTTTVYCRNMGL